MRRAAICLALVAALAIPASASAAKGKERDEKLTVMTRNVFLGADLGPAIEAADIPSAIDGAGEIWNEMELTNFPERAVPLAKELKRSKAALIGLQEVATWYQQVPSDGGAPPISPIEGAQPATDVRYDFLQLLLDRLGGKYEVVVDQPEFEGELPVDVDRNDATGTGPLAGFGADFDARLVMHDVILARKGTDVKLGKTSSAHYETRYAPSISGIVINVDRGWGSVDAKLGDEKFRFVDTHLEAFGDPTIREAQAKEIVAGPLDTKKQVILTGDLNSGTTGRHNIGRPELGHDPDDPLAFKVFKKAKFKDNGAVQSCCYPDMFDPTFEFTHTVDHVLTRPGLKTVESHVTGNDPGERTPSGLWPSDHGGVVSTLEFP
ncbi:MAG TPA: endonuclease/exonuclease/phosphatase family protein [Candidatus Limnocylindrales bacterium]|nr:endonuclease/exonuclease/phosphatase family protein [Candidatus Limnocylindrales bacterium]